MQPDCEKCLILQAEKMLKKHHVSEDAARDIISRFNIFLDENRNNGIQAGSELIEE